MKLDIEGHEFRVLPTLVDKHMHKIKQLVVEIHSPGDIALFPDYFRGLSDVTHETMFDLLHKINRTHTLVHVHPNNGCHVHYYNGVKLPNVFECTYIRNDYTKVLSNENLPIPLDMPNVVNKPIEVFTGPPFSV